MAKHVKPLTAVGIKTKPPGMHADGDCLYLLVRKQGEIGSWVFRYRDRVTGKLRDMGLGRALGRNGVTLAEAREKAEQKRVMLRDGQDPLAEKHSQLAEAKSQHEKRMSFGRCAELYIQAHRSEWRNPKHAQQWDSTLRTYCEPIWQLPVDMIDLPLVMRCLVGPEARESLWESKPETMSRVRGRMERVLAWATIKKLRTGDNPAQWRNHLDTVLSKRNKVRPVEHRAALPYAEAAEFMTELRQRNNLAARSLELQILTATRPGEAAGARWDEIDLERALWIIPADRMKAKKAHRIPLAPVVVKLLQALPQLGPHVFPGVRGKPITTDAAMKLLKEMRPSITAHGFRSTFRDWAAETTSHPREVIEAAMAHRLKDAAEAAYQRGDLLQRRAVLMKDWAGYCGTVRKGATVTALKYKAG